MSRILLTGANGQIGTALGAALRDRHGSDHVVSLDLTMPPTPNGRSPVGPFEVADVRDRDALGEIAASYDIDVVYHLASLLSATSEKQPDRAWDVNVNGLKNVLDLAREHDLRVFWPSSIAVFGPSTPKIAPQETVLNPTTMYGVAKRSGELLCAYYHRRYGVDVRSLRLPGLVSYETEPVGGTTDYAVDMFVHAVCEETYTCYLTEDVHLPMMYMPDAIRATLMLMGVEEASLSVRDSYNLGALSFSPRDLATAIRRRVPEFSSTFQPDDRQQIAEHWPQAVDDEAARADWGWFPEFDLEAMTEDMLEHLRKGERERGKDV